MKQRPFNRLITLDFLKTMAIWLMVYDHLLKYLADYSAVMTSHSLLLFIQFTPLASFLFLSISGYTLSSSWDRRKSGWVKRKLKHALILIGLSLLLLPTKNIDTFTIGSYFSSGILQTIGFFQLLALPLLYLFQKPAHRLIWYTLAISGLMILNHILLSNLILIPFITSDSFPLIPFAPWFLVGLLSYELTALIHKLPKFGVFWGLATILTTYLVFSPLQQVWVVERYWQPSWILTLWLMIGFILFVHILMPFEKIIRKNLLLQKISLPGKYSLTIYVSHLYFLWLLSFSIKMHKVFEFWIALAFIFGFINLVAIFLDYKSSRLSAGRTPQQSGIL